MSVPPPYISPILNAALTDQAVHVNQVITYMLPNTYDANGDTISILTMRMQAGALASFITYSND